MIKPSTHRTGNITLMAVFMTAMIAFLLLLGDNIRSLGDTAAARADAVTEQAFYASQSCLEEAYWQLRVNPAYQGVQELVVGTARCTLRVEPSTENARNGRIVSTGLNQDTLRTISSNYTEAGPTTTRNATKIFHVIDRSGSMQEDSCSTPDVNTQTECLPPLVWGPRLEPITTAKEAAQQFTTSFLASGFDQIGVISYSDNAVRNQGLSSDIPTINQAIQNIATPSGGTNIGAAIQLADYYLPADGQGVRAMIVLTDGVPNSPSCPRDCIINRAATAKNDHGILLFTIGLGETLDRELLDTIASRNSETGTPFSYYAATRDTLAEIYQQIKNEITRFNIGQGSWYEE